MGTEVNALIATDESGRLLVCTGCGTSRDLAAIRAAGGLSCCPERNMVGVFDLVAPLMNAATVFDRYAALHRCKGTPEGDLKAQRNVEMATAMRRPLRQGGVPIEPKWRWWVGRGEDAECFTPVEGDADEAVRVALEHVDQAGDAVTITEAHQAWAWNTRVFDADTVLDWVEDKNEMAFGENGREGVLDGPGAELERELAGTLGAWIHRHGGDSWGFADQRNGFVMVAVEEGGELRLVPSDHAVTE